MSGLIQRVDPKTASFETIYDACDGHILRGPKDIDCVEKLRTSGVVVLWKEPAITKSPMRSAARDIELSHEQQETNLVDPLAPKRWSRRTDQKFTDFAKNAVFQHNQVRLFKDRTGVWLSKCGVASCSVLPPIETGVRIAMRCIIKNLISPPTSLSKKIVATGCINARLPNCEDTSRPSPSHVLSVCSFMRPDLEEAATCHLSRQVAL